MADEKKEITYIGPRGYPKDAVTNSIKKETADLKLDLFAIGGLAVSILGLLFLFVAVINLFKKIFSYESPNYSSGSLDADPLGDGSELTDDDLDFDKQSNDKEQAWQDDLAAINYEIDRDRLHADHIQTIEDPAQFQTWEELQQEREALDFEVMSMHESMLISNGFEHDHILTDEEIEELGLDWFDVRESEALVQRYTDDADDDEDSADKGSENQKSEPVDSSNSEKSHVS